MGRLYLGLDSSTQSLTAVLIDIDLSRIVYQQSLNFSAQLSHYRTDNGVLPDGDPAVVHAPPLMWVEALDRLLLQLQADGCAMEAIIAVAGSAQQHGSVYLNDAFDPRLKKLRPDFALHQQLSDLFSRKTTPIWMDSSTGSQCAGITAAFGGADQLNAATGSVAMERFSGAQIKKFAELEPQAYAKTAKIALVSSFMASLLAGRHVSIDYSDASGMNILDIRNRTWHPTALAVCGENLKEKLTPAIDPTVSLGEISNYFVGRYGFNPRCQILPWCGDNPSSLIGLGLVESGMTAISLGTSDTCFGVMQQLPEQMSPWANTFITPANNYMSLLCFKNGSLARERVRQQFNLSWDGFSAGIKSTPPGNRGAMMLPWFDSEIVPRIKNPGVKRFDLAEDDLAGNCRAVIEAQMMAMCHHADQAGLKPTAIRATGGGSHNRVILQIMADIFAAPVDRMETTNSAALGAALRAVKAIERVSWSEAVAGWTDVRQDSHLEPERANGAVYQQLQRTYAEREAEILNAFH